MSPERVNVDELREQMLQGLRHARRTAHDEIDRRFDQIERWLATGGF